jgi:hypothetical protein
MGVAGKEDIHLPETIQVIQADNKLLCLTENNRSLVP